MLKADFHIHTSYSQCSNLKPAEIIKQSLLIGLDIIGVVDHDDIRGGLLAKKLAGNKIIVIPGEEIKTEYGDLIVFNSDGKYSRNLIEICKRAKELNHFIYAPHPFDSIRFSLCEKMNEIKKYVNAIEIENSRCVMNKFNNTAKKFAKTNKLLGLAGSDAHFKNEIGKCINYIDSDEFNLNKIKVSKMICEKNLPGVHLRSSMERFLKS